MNYTLVIDEIDDYGAVSNSYELGPMPMSEVKREIKRMIRKQVNDDEGFAREHPDYFDYQNRIVVKDCDIDEAWRIAFTKFHNDLPSKMFYVVLKDVE